MGGNQQTVASGTKARTVLLVSAVALGLSGPATAQFTVIDPAHIAETIARGVNEVRQLERQYGQLAATYEAITGARDMGGIAGTLGGMSRSYMPGASSVPGLLHGSGGSFGAAQSLLQRNRAYAPTQRDEWTVEMERRETVTANAQALAGAGLEDAQERIAKLEHLRHSLEQARDTREVEAVNGMIAVEQQNLAAHRAQIEHVRLLLATDERVQRQRAEQMIRRDADAVAEQTRPGLEGW